MHTKKKLTRDKPKHENEDESRQSIWHRHREPMLDFLFDRRPSLWQQINAECNSFRYQPAQVDSNGCGVQFVRLWSRYFAGCGSLGDRSFVCHDFARGNARALWP